MKAEPSYLADLGELATLKNAIGGWYHQDAYLDFETDEDIWQSIVEGLGEDGMHRLTAQISELLARKDHEVLELWNANSHCHGFANAHEAREFLGSMVWFFKGAAK
ncbi:contact-dependent growth inhibition system immunity protein [Paucibacter sediminis]|uniref:Contact-dependent growth inhibition system immunity protein n=1 Tax=Paucibacter sediminis TaxID=3019553 RepID=A0AA95SR59_9BURK|nr:contact-dependent growth inhibition system immunity protein [Paucibacter sp. S2-9]WIT14315.1 contact-dependent growth inhibition system immunity protein [Paucibacter sp. S2-9]